MDTLIIALIVTVWIGVVLPAVLLPFLPRNLDTRVRQAAARGARLSFLTPQRPRDTSGGQAVA